ncbi:hypothetical protein BAE44_0023237 [Dichanthelium oligosanthes]|uniref:Jacalin-type lectin domain-containing protein n=1 Tax=Dichanthelium oligosanthes TaxID=888268 RepID=A0A1E5USD3_9POAL|nr:hypothetical protein BAE44_0023237 [Dichanthelium oligosanthes]
MGVAPKLDDEYSIVGGSGEFALANGVVNRVVHSREGSTDIDRLTIKLVTKIGPWGGNGGSDADVRVLPHRLESAVIRHGVVVDSIGYSYVDQAGRKHTAGPWGGNGGIYLCIFPYYQHNLYLKREKEIKITTSHCEHI